jgi:hypothetical protein
MTCFPVATNFYGWTQESISGVVNLLSLHGLWRLVIDDNGESVIYIERFEEHQILRGDRETPSKYVFSNGVANSSTIPLEQWWSNSKNPPRNSRGTPTKLPQNAHEVQVQVQDQEEVEVEARVRATTSPESSRKTESHYETPRVISAWKAVSPDYAITFFDRAAIQRHAHHLPKDLEGFFREKIGLGKWKLEWALDELNKPQGNGGAEPFHPEPADMPEWKKPGNSPEQVRAALNQLKEMGIR